LKLLTASGEIINITRDSDKKLFKAVVEGGEFLVVFVF